MKKIFTLFCFTLSLFYSKAQLQIGAGTSWKSVPGIYVVLDSMSLQHDATSVSLDNIFKFTGNTNASISGATLPFFTNLNIGLTGSSKIILQRSINVSQDITFLSGLLDLNNNMIDLGTTGTLTGENENSRIIGDAGGYVEASAILNNPSSANPGNLGAMITSTQDLGSTIIRCGHKYQVIGANHSIKRYFDILPTNNTSLNATLRFNYFDAELNSLDETIIDMYPSIDYINWTDAGIDIRNTGSNYSEKTGINSFARWTLFNPTGALPVTGMLLSGRWRNNAVQLNWTTFTEINNDHFNIERKYSDENDFRTVTTKKSFYLNGNSQSPTGYNLTDPAVSNRGLIFYRLKQIDKNGRFAYSNTIALRPETLKVFIEKTFPTLATELSIYVQTGGLNLQKMSMEVFDMAGKLYLSKELNYESQWVTLPVLASGLYSMKIQSGEYLYQQSFFKK